jgi:hypothetical protein
MVGSLPDGCTRLGRSAPEEDRLAKWNEEVNRTGEQRIGEEKYKAETLRTQRREKQSKERQERPAADGGTYNSRRTQDAAT